MSNQLSLLDLLPSAPDGCHDCGNALTAKDAVVPKTCAADLSCTRCCVACHHQALSRMMTGQSPIPWPQRRRSR